MEVLELSWRRRAQLPELALPQLLVISLASRPGSNQPFMSHLPSSSTFSKPLKPIVTHTGSVLGASVGT